MVKLANPKLNHIMIGNIDTLKNLKKSIDSLKKVISTNNDWHQIKIHEAPVQAALIVAFSTILTVALGFVFKDYWIPRWTEKRNKKLESQYLFNHYKSQLIVSSFTFLKRLHEIYVTRSHYLWKETPMSSFYQYKYKSSIYRLCVLLGAIRAYRLTEPSLVLKDYKISSALNKLESCLADGQQVEMYVVKSICKINDINAENIKKDVLEKFSVEIDDLVQRFQEEHGEEYIADLKPELQEEFIKELDNLMKSLNINCSNIYDKKKEIIKEVSIKLALIYRDWQQAIGDLMLKRSEDGIYSTLSFKDFEKKWDKYKNGANNIWLQRVEKIFENLDLRVDVNSDSRIGQLKRVYDNAYTLMDKLYNINSKGSPINESAFKSVPVRIEM